MNDSSTIKSSSVFFEINQRVLKGLKDGNRVELSLDRDVDGRLTPACREKLASGLKAFINKKPLQAKLKVLCALGATGVSLRQLSLPSATKEEFEKVLRLRIEAEFPLAPDDLAWGYLALETPNQTKREVLVAAVKKEVVAEYVELFAACGLESLFTLAAFTRNLMCPSPNGSHASLDVSSDRPEWAIFENGLPTSLRILPAKNDLSLLDSVANALGTNSTAKVIYLTGASNDLVTQLAARLAGRIACVPVAAEAGEWTAVLGLKKATEPASAPRLIILENRVAVTKGAFRVSSPEVKPWLVGAAALLCLLLLLPFLQAVILKPLLTRKLDTLKANKDRLVMIDRELEFLQSLKQTQPPYLDALFLLAKSAAPGARFDSINMDRQGNVSLHGTMQNGTQVTDLRAKMISSGFFANVAVEEQSPSPDRQHVNVRMTAHWKSVEGRTGLAVGPTPEEIQQAKTNLDAGGPGGGMPPGMAMPMMMH